MVSGVDYAAQDMERLACNPLPLDPKGFNSKVVIPYGCKIDHIRKAMVDFLDFLGFINQQLYTKQIPRFESFLIINFYFLLITKFKSNLSNDIFSPSRVSNFDN